MRPRVPVRASTATDAELLANPYLFFECDRRSADRVAFGAVDRGLFPDESIRRRFPVPEPSRIDDPADARRVRALVVDLLEEAAAQGHTLLPRSWVIRRARERSLQPPCPLGENVLDATEESFGSVVARTTTRAGEAAYQVDRLVECRDDHPPRDSRDERRASRTAPVTTGVGSWTPGSASLCRKIRATASWRSVRGRRRQPHSSSSSARGCPS